MKHHETLRGVQQLRTLQHQSVPLFLSKGSGASERREVDSKFKSHDAQLNNIHGDCWYFQQLYARISRKQAPWRPGAVLSMDRSTARRSGDLGSGCHHQLILGCALLQAFVTQHC